MKTKLLLLFSCIVPFLVFSQSPSRIALGTTSGNAIQGFQTKYTTRTLPAALVPRAVTVAPRPGVAADINSIDRTVCEGQAVTLAAQTTTVNNPVFRWYAEPALTTLLSTGVYYTHLPSNVTKSYYITVTGTDSATGDAVTENVPGTAKVVTMTQSGGTVPGVGDFTVSDVTICPGGTATISPVTSVANANYFWYSDAALANRITTGTTFEASPAATTTYYVMIVQGASSCHSLPETAQPVTVTVGGIPAVATDIKVTGATTACDSGAMQLTATLNTGVTIPNPVFTWYSDAALTTPITPDTPGGTSITVSPTALTNYYVTVKGDGVCENAPGTAKVVPLAAPVITGERSVCVGGTIDIQVSGFPAGTTYLWTDPRGITQATNRYAATFVGLIISGGYTLVITYPDGTTFNLCTTVLVQPNAAAGTITVNGSKAICPGDLPALTLTNTLIPEADVIYRWYTNVSLDPASLVTTGATYNGTIPTVNTTYYVTLEGPGYCQSTTGQSVLVTLRTRATAANITATGRTICEGGSATLTATTTGVTGAIISWYSDASLSAASKIQEGSPLTVSPLVTTDYYCTVRGTTICENVPGDAKAVTVTVTAVVAPTGAAAQTLCDGNRIADLVTNEPGVVWFSTPTGGTALSETAFLVTGRTYYGELQSGSCVSPTRLAVTVTLNPNAQSNIIFPVSVPGVCYGEVKTVTVTAPTVTNPIFRWYEDNALTVLLHEGPTFDTPPITAGWYGYVTVQGVGLCENRPNTGKAFYVSLNPTSTATDMTVAGTREFCVGQPTTTTLTATPVTNYGGTEFNWYGDAALTNLLFTGNSFTVTPTATTTYFLTLQSDYRCENIPGEAQEVAVTVKAPALPTDITVSDRTVCTGSTAALTATSTLTSPTFTWYSDAALTTVVSTQPTYTTPVLTSTTAYYVTVQNATTCESAAVTVQGIVAERPLASDIITQNEVQVCDVPFPATVTLTASVGPEFTNVYWYSNAGLTTLVNTGSTFTVPVTAGGATRSYWVTTTRTGSRNCQNIPAEAQRVNVYTLPAYVPGSITITGNRPLCLGETQELVATATTDSGSETGIKWYSDESLDPAFLVHDGANFTPVLTATTTFYVQLIGFAYCPNIPGNGKVVTVVVNPVPAAPTGAAAQSFCGAPTVADLVINETTPVIWYTVPTGGTALATTTALVTGTTYYAAFPAATGVCESDRLAVAVTIKTTPPITVINGTVSPASVCTGSTVTFSATAPTVTAPVFRWYDDNPASGGILVHTGADFTTVLNSTSYEAIYFYVTVQGTNTCESPGRPFNALVKPYATAFSASAANVLLCGSNTTTLLASSSVTSPVYKWYRDPDLTDFLGSGFVFPVTVTDPVTIFYLTVEGIFICQNLPGNAREVKVYMQTVQGSDLIANDATICAGSPVTLSASRNNGIAVGAFTWYSDQALGAANVLATGSTFTPNPAPTVTTTYYVTYKDTQWCENVPGDAKAVTVTVTAVAPPTGDAAQSFCIGATIADLVTNEPGVEWFITPTGGAALAATVTLSYGRTYYGELQSGGCVSPTRLAVAVTLNPYAQSDMVFPVSVPGVCYGEVKTVTVTAPSVTNPIFRWYSDQTLTVLLHEGPTFDTPPITANYGGFVTVQGDGICENRPSTAKTFSVSLNPTSVATDMTVAGTREFCVGQPTTTTLTATPVTNYAGTEFNWYTNAALTDLLFTGAALTVTPTATTTYYLTLKSDYRCENIPGEAQEVTVTINDPQTPTGNATQVFCTAGIVGDLVTNETGVEWYTTPTGGVALPPATALQNRIYYGSLTVGSCESPVRFAVTVMVTAVAPPTGDAAQSFCSVATIADIVTNEPNVIWYAAATGGTALPATTALANATTYYGELQSGSCVSPTRLAVAVTINPQAVAADIMADGIRVCDGEVGEFSASSITVTNPVFRWYRFTAPNTFTLLGTGDTFIPPSPGMAGGPSDIYYVSVSGDNYCENQLSTGTLKSVIRNVSKYTLASDIVVSDQAICAGQSATVPITAPAISGSSSRIRVYSDNLLTTLVHEGAGWTTGTVFTTGPLTTTTTYYITAFSNTDCENAVGTAKVLTITVNTPAAPGAITVPDIAVCLGAPVAFTATAPTITNPVFTWYEDGTLTTALATGATFTPNPAPVVTTSYYVTVQGDGVCESTPATAKEVTVTISGPAAPAIPPTQNVCVQLPGRISDLLPQGPAFKWYAAATGGAPLSFATQLVDGTTYYVSETQGSCESTRTAVLVTVTSVVPWGDWIVPLEWFCFGEPVTFEASSPGDLIINPIYRWYSDEALTNLVHTGPTYTVTPTVDGTFYAFSTAEGDGQCENKLFSHRATAFVKTIPTVADIIADDQGGCVNSTITLSGSSPTVSGAIFNWYSDPALTTLVGTGATLDITQAAAGTYLYYVTVQSGRFCESTPANARVVTVTITADPGAPVADATQDFCAVSTPTVADLTATGTTIQWYDAATAGSLLAPTTALISGNTYYASQTIGTCESSLRTAVVVTIAADPSAPTADATQDFCAVNTPTVADLTATGTTIQWYDAATAGNLLAPATALIDGTIYYASQTVGICESSLRTAVLVTIAADPSAPVADATQDFCAASTPTVADLTATGTNIQWYDAATAGNLLAPTTALVDGNTYYASQTVGICESSLRTAVLVTIAADPSAPVADATQDFCAASTPTVADLTATGTTIQWYDAATAGNLLAPTTALVDGTTYYASQTVGICESSLRTAVVVTIAADPSAPVADATQDFCAASTPTVADLTATGTNIQWYDAATAGNLLAPTTALIDGNTYYASQTIGTCESSLRTAVLVTIAADPSAPVADATQDFCAASTPTIADLTATGTTIQWYDAATAGNLLAPTTALVDGTTYYASQTVGICESSLRTAVLVSIAADPSAPVADATQDFCAASTPTVADLTATGTNIQWYDAATAGNLLAPTTALVDGNIYYASQTVGICESSLRTAVLVTIAADPSAPVADATQDFCAASTPTVADLTATGTTIQWYDAATAGNLLAPATALIDGTIYYASQTVGICESSLRTAVLVTIAADPSAPVADATQDFCAASTPTVADLTAIGTTIQWYDAATAGNLLAPTTALVDGNTYYASQTIGTCESSVRTAVTVTLVTLGAPTTGDITQEFCSTDAPTLADIQVNEPDIRWYASATGGTPLPTGTALTDGTTYYAAQYNAALNCESALRLAILVILRTDVPGETIGWDADVCLQETVTYTTNSGMSDYDWIVTGGTIVGGGQLTDNFVTIEWTTAGNGSVGVSFINAANCNPLVEIDFAVLVTACGDLAVTKAVNTTTPAIGDNIVFTINVTHLGNGAFTDIIINENLPAGYQYVSAQASVGTYNATNGLWTIPFLDANATATLLITATVRGSGEYLNVAYLESSLPTDPNPDNNRGEATINPNGIFIYNGISPNGDGLNDYLKIDGLSRYPNNTVEIYNRYGVKVYDTKGYDTTGNVFRGISDGRATTGDAMLPVGTYFYTIRYETPEGNTVKKSGYIYITE